MLMKFGYTRLQIANKRKEELVKANPLTWIVKQEDQKQAYRSAPLSGDYRN
jgi:hypothetical protein